MKTSWVAAAAAVAALASGCAMFDEPAKDPPPAEPAAGAEDPAVVAKVAPAPPPAPPKPSPQVLRMIEVDSLLSDFERMRRLSAAELAREQESARHAFNQTRTDAARVRYAMALAVPGATATESGALELLDPLVKNPTGSLHGLAFLLTAYIQEQRRLTSQVQGLQQNMQGLQQNLQALQQKLDALRTLERSLTERETAAPKRR